MGMKPRVTRESWMWLSFAGTDGFRGAAMVFAKDVADAAQKAWDMNINPGGEVLAHTIPGDFPVPTKFQGKLLTKDECAELNELWATLKEPN